MAGKFYYSERYFKSALTDFGEEICYLKLKDETVTPAKGRSQLKRPLSVVDVEAVLFESEEEVTRFRNSYGQFADVPLEFFTLKAFSSPSLLVQTFSKIWN